jgi:hypothetical protein
MDLARATTLPDVAKSAPTTPKSASTFDAKTLLSPKTGKGTRDEPTVVDDDDGITESGHAPMLERLHRVEERKETPVRRRKLEDTEDGNDANKKTKFEIKGGSGVITEFKRDENQKDVDEIKDGLGVASVIDLTGKCWMLEHCRHATDI